MSTVTICSRLSLGCLLLTLTAGSAIAAEAQRVLMVHSFGSTAPPFTTHSTAFETTLTKELGSRVDLDEVSLDMARYAEPDMELPFVELLRRRLEKWKPDLVVPIGSPAGRFVNKYRDRLFPRTPVIYTGMDRRTLPPGAIKNATFVGEDFKVAGLVEDILELAPDTNHIVVVLGATPLERYWAIEFQKTFAPFTDRVKFTWVNDLTFEQMLELAARLPPRSFILLGLLLRDAAGVTHNEDEALQRLHAVASAPINGLYQHQLGLGIVGGRLYQAELQGEESARIAIRVLRGEPVSNFPPLIVPPQGPRYDWRELRRWKIGEDRLPPGSLVAFRQLTAWERYRWYIVAAVTLLLVQAALIVGLLVHRSQRQRAQRALAERLRFETLLAEMSAALLTRRAGEIDREIERMLERVGREMEFDRAILAERIDGANAARVTHSWTRDGITAVPETFEAAAYPWIVGRLARGEPVHLPQLEALPVEATTDRFSFERSGVRSLTVVPLVVQGTTVGALAFSSLRRERIWPAELLPRLQLLADGFASALARQRADSAVRESDERRRQAEKETRQQREELAHALRVTTLSELTASLAHELNQPLTAVAMNAKAGRRLLQTGSALELDEILDDIGRDATRAGEVVHRLRVLLRKGEPERKPLDINQLVAGVATLVRHDLERARVSLRLTLSELLPLVSGDAVQLQQVVLNLLLNACDALSELDDGPRVLDVATNLSGPGRIVVTVRDSGVGVPESELARIFEPFVTTKTQGLGMGLAISRSIVEAHGGRIWATRNDDRGLTMHVELPA
jgi:C4-dicarboxylate-specific signal transduction histidine kinase